MFSNFKNKYGLTLAIIVIVALAAVIPAYSSGALSNNMFNQNQPVVATNLQIKGQHPNKSVYIPVTGLANPIQDGQRLSTIASVRQIDLIGQNPGNSLNLQEEQRINDLVSARWAGLGAMYSGLEQQRLNDLASARWAGLASQYSGAAVTEPQGGQSFNDPVDARLMMLAARNRAREELQTIKYYDPARRLPGR